ncbi:hypothetical protein BGZ58_006047 [Dissophora ornata]|nr:hypothetical protein BGZ58_006047 [Dissophora ornata]
MNVLVNYASDSESDIEQEPLAPQQNAESKNKGDDDESILAALKDLQDFAASVDTPTTSNNATGTTQQLITSATAAVAGPSQDDDLGFLSFMKEIDAIPFPPQEQEQEQALPPPPPPPPPLTSLDVVPPPPPTPPPMVPSEIQQSEADYETLASRIAQEVQMVHNRLYHLSLLPSTSIDQKDLERRLLEFAIRIADWQRGGLYEPYFLGMERAEVISTCQRTAGTAVEDMTELPPFGGIVGPMVKHMYELEHMAAPPGWIAIWDQADEAYGFQHTSTWQNVILYFALNRLLNRSTKSFGECGTKLLEPGDDLKSTLCDREYKSHQRPYPALGWDIKVNFCNKNQKEKTVRE